MDETRVMNLIVYAGNARSLAMEALAKAKTGDFDGAQVKQDEAAKAMNEAHKLQTSILEESLDRPELTTPLLMVHAQDHLMNAITVLELAKELCELYQCIKSSRN
ncbi:MAG: PTS lactose/cellobiose transporter subunit IIA [Treponema sp.]|nr:PTS lactose/cellobiose transporter subunit IIA [Treponema sp.]